MIALVTLFVCISAPLCLAIYGDMKIALSDKEIRIMELKKEIAELENNKE